MTSQHQGRCQGGIQVGDVLHLVSAVTVVGLLALIYEGRSKVPRILLALAFTSFVPGRAIVVNWPWASAR